MKDLLVLLWSLCRWTSSTLEAGVHGIIEKINESID